MAEQGAVLAVNLRGQTWLASPSRMDSLRYFVFSVSRLLKSILLHVDHCDSAGVGRAASSHECDDSCLTRWFNDESEVLMVWRQLARENKTQRRVVIDTLEKRHACLGEKSK